MNCQNTTEFFSDYYDGGLQAAERQQLEEHLRSCGTCTTEYRHFTRSLEALHETRPLETTAVFMTNLKSAATQHLDRKQNYPKTKSESVTMVTPKADSKPLPKADRSESRTILIPKRIVVPAWVPWALAATTLVAFGLGILVSGRKTEPEITREQFEAVQKSLNELMKRAAVPPAPPDERKILQANGLVETVEGQWIPVKWAKDFEQKKVCINGEMMTREQAAKMLAKEFPVEPPPPAPVASNAPNVDELLDKVGYSKVNDVYVPKDWVEKWGKGMVQTGVGEWRKLSDFEEELIKEHNLVKVRGKLMTREQADAIMAEQFVKTPANALAANDFTRTLDGLQIGPPMNSFGLTVYPLLAAQAPPAAPFVTIHSVLGSDKVEIIDSIGLFQVQVRNDLSNDILLLSGEILTGGRCTRVVSEHTLVPRGKVSQVPVLCVEPSVWKAPGEKFAKESGHFLAPPQLRRSLLWEQGQGALWSLLSKRLAGRAGGLVDLYKKQPDEIPAVRAYFSALPEREPTAVGLAVAIGDSLEFAELFPDHETFSAYFERLVAGAALDVLERGELPPRVPSPIPNSMKGVKQLLEAAFLCSYETREDGFAIRRDDAAVGRVRIAGGAVQHAVLFASGAPEWERKAAYTVPKEKVKKALDEYEVRLKTQGPARKIATLHELGSINSPDIVDLLKKHLTETDTAVRRTTLQELGATGDPRAVDILLSQIARSAQDPAAFAEIVHALVRLGFERAVDPLVKVLDSGEPELARIVIEGFADLLRQVKSRDVLERATGRLVSLYEAAEGVAKGEGGIADPLAKTLKAVDAPLFVESLRGTLKQVVGIEFSTAAGARRFWNDRDARERFLQTRTAK